MESPESTGVYKCPHCGNASDFTGIDEHGYGGPDACHSEACDPDECHCDTELRQDFTVVKQDGTRDGANIHYEAFEGGESDAEIGHYTKIVCRRCRRTIWEESGQRQTSAAPGE